MKIHSRVLLAALLSGEFLRPGQVDARVGPELEAVILRCLKRVPGERFADGQGVGMALRELSAAWTSVGDEGAALRAFHADHAAFERRIGGGVADAAVERARAHVRKGELGKALAQINRALAYAPGHRGAEAVLATISTRRRWVKGAAVVATLAIAGVAVAGVRHLARRAPATVVARAAAPEPSSPTPPPVAATAAAPPAPAVIAAPTPPEHEAVTPKKHERGKRAASRPSEPVAVAAPTPAPEAPPEPVAPPPVAPAVTRPAPAPTGGITLRARQGFCSPSLDDRAPALRPIYESVAVGAHAVYCTPPGGARVLAGTYELRAGTHPDLVIVPGPDGRPTLSRPQ